MKFSKYSTNCLKSFGCSAKCPHQTDRDFFGQPKICKQQVFLVWAKAEFVEVSQLLCKVDSCASSLVRNGCLNSLSSKVWCICPSRYTGGTLFQVWLARFRWGRGRASFKSGHKEVKNYTCAAPRAPAAPANDPKRQANTSVSGRRRTVTKREFIKWNLKSSWCLGRGCWSNQ